MNDDFLHRIRIEPPRYFIAALKTRLDQTAKDQTRRLSMRSRGLIMGGLIAGAALATGLFAARILYSPPSDGNSPSLAAPSIVDNQPPRLRSQPSTTSDVAEAPSGKSSAADKTGRLGIGASVAVAAHIKAATGYMNRNLNLYPQFAEPTVSMMSSNAVFASLCGAGGDSISAAVVDRRIFPSELDVCHRLGKRIAELKIGYEAIALVRSGLYGAPKLGVRSLFLALAREVPDPLNPGELIRNPNTTWDQVDSSLPNEHIDVSGPPLSGATGIALRELILKPGCSTFPTIAALKETNPERFEDVCGAIRADGVYQIREVSRNAGNNPSDFTDYLNANPQAIALLGYQERTLRAWNLAAASIDGVAPSPPAIRSGSYPGARAIYIYANTAVSHMRDFVLAVWSSVGNSPGDALTDTTLMSVDSDEERGLWKQVLTLPELKLQREEER